MTQLTDSQSARLDEATRRLDELTEKRPPSIPDEESLAAVINVMATAARRLEAGETIHIQIKDADGRELATAPIALENL